MTIPYSLSFVLVLSSSPCARNCLFFSSSSIPPNPPPFVLRLFFVASRHTSARRLTLCEKSTWMRWSSISTFCILKYARSASAFSLYSMKAYCRLSPVRLSRMTSQDRICPNREKMSCSDSSSVTGLSLHTKSTFSGGATSAKGRSPTISSVSACCLASRSRRSLSTVA